MQLRNYGKDYDKPGQTQICCGCGGITSEPAVGFVCLDCDAHADGEAAKRIDIHAYSLTEEAVATLTRSAESVAIKALPQALIADLRRLTSMQASSGVDIAVAEIRYGARQDILQAKGEPVFERLRALFLENMANFLAGIGTVYPGETADYLLLEGFGDTLAVKVDQLMTQSQGVLSVSLLPQVRLASSMKRALP
jgi:hypothetical protein